MKAISQINSEASWFWLILTDYLSKNLSKRIIFTIFEAQIESD